MTRKQASRSNVRTFPTMPHDSIAHILYTHAQTVQLYNMDMVPRASHSLPGADCAEFAHFPRRVRVQWLSCALNSCGTRQFVRLCAF